MNKSVEFAEDIRDLSSMVSPITSDRVECFGFAKTNDQENPFR